MTDKRIISEQRTLSTLSYLHRFGWLTNRMLSALVWPEASQGDSMARRMLKRLVDERQVLRRLEPESGQAVFTLASAGAKRLRDELGVDAQSGKSLRLGNCLHRACSNWFLITKLVQGFDVTTEHEIQTGRAPWCSVEGKTADGAVESSMGTIWVEVENAWKNRARRGAIAAFVEHGFRDSSRLHPLGEGRHLFRVAIVATNSSALNSMVQMFAEGFTRGELRDAQLASVEMVLQPVSQGLIPGPVTEQNLWYDLLC